MLEIQPNKEPFLFVNKTIEVNYLQSATCSVFLSPDEWFFKCHWPGNPNMPAALQLETMTQVGGMILFGSLKNKPEYLYVRKITNTVFYRKIIPNTEIIIISETKKYQKGILSVESEIRCKKSDILFSKSQFSLINPEDVPKVSR